MINEVARVINFAIEVQRSWLNLNQVVWVVVIDVLLLHFVSTIDRKRDHWFLWVFACVAAVAAVLGIQK